MGLYINKKVFKLQLLRDIDKYVGPVLGCFLLFFQMIFNIFFPRKNSNKNKAEVKKILVIKFFGMGSILLASSVLGQVKKKFPSSKIAILTLTENNQVCEIIPWIDKIYLLNLQNVSKFFLNYLNLLRIIRRENFDVIVDLEFLTNFSALTVLLLGLFRKDKILVGFNSPLSWRNAVFTLNISFDHSRHISIIFGKVFSSFCGDTFDVPSSAEEQMFLNYAETSFLKDIPQLASSIDSNKNRNICININSGALSLLRRWPLDYFATLIRKLLLEYNLNIFLIGGKDDRAYVAKILSDLPDTPQIVNLCGKLSIKQLLGLYSKCAILITNDSGPLHLACALGLPTISFFGPETPSLYGPQGENHYVFYEDIYCSPCLNIYNSKMSHCQDNICLKNISPASVLKLMKEKNILGPGHAKTLSEVESC